MAKVHKVDTIELLKSFWEFVYMIGDNPSQIPDSEVNETIGVFIKQKFPEINNHEKDIWNLVVTDKNK